MHIIDHKHRFALYLIVFGQMEEHVDIAQAYAFKLLSVHLSLPDDVVLLESGQTRIPQVEHVVVCPHEEEFHAVSVSGFKESVAQGGLHEGSSVIPVPVKDEYVDAMVHSLADFHFHHSRVGLVDITP